MAKLLQLCGFKLESLEDFQLQCSQSFNSHESFSNFYISHKNEKNIPESTVISQPLTSPEYYLHFHRISATSNPHYDQLKLEHLYQQLMDCFGKSLTLYLLEECYLFEQINTNCYTPVTHFVEVNMVIGKFAERKKTKGMDLYKYRRKVVLLDGLKNMVEHSRMSPDLFDDDDMKMNSRLSPDLFADVENKERNTRKPKPVNCSKLLEIYKRLDQPMLEEDNYKNDPINDELFLGHMLYNTKQQTRWPESHALSKNSVDVCLHSIIDVKLNIETNVNELLEDSKNWDSLRGLLGLFINNHQKLVQNNGFIRVLEQHGKNVIDFGTRWKKRRKNGGNVCKHADGHQTPRTMKSIPTTIVTSYLIDVLNQVLPHKLLVNKKVFFKFIARVIKSAKYQLFLLQPLMEPLLKTQILWAKDMKNSSISTIMLIKLMKWLIMNYATVILKNVFFITETGTSSYGLHYYLKSDVQSAIQRFTNEMLRNGQIKHFNNEEYEKFCVERKWLDTGKIESKDFRKLERKTLPSDRKYIQPIAKIRFLPKKNNTVKLRMITNFTNMSKMSKYYGKKIRKKKQKNLVFKWEEKFIARLSYRRHKLGYVKKFLELLVEKFTRNKKPFPDIGELEKAWLKAVSLKEATGKLYFVKADISEAFSSIKLTRLRDIINHYCTQLPDPLPLNRITYWKLKNGVPKLQKTNTFRNSSGENSIFINSSSIGHRNKKLPSYSMTTFKSILAQVLFRQRLLIGGKLYRLTNGLAQGCAGAFSPLLCELYYNSMDEMYFKDLNTSDSVLLRRVDDYLLLTSNLGKAREFYNLLYLDITYFNAHFNREKLISNINSPVITVEYFGFIFNFLDLSVTSSYSKYENKNILQTMLLTSKGMFFKKYKILEKRLLRLTCLKLQTILLNEKYNDIKVIRRNIFCACLFQANRFLHLCRYLYLSKDKNDLDIFVLIYRSRNKIYRLLSQHCSLTFNEISFIYFYSFYLTFYKFSGQFKDLICLIVSHLDNFEKVFKKQNFDCFLTTLKDDLGFESCNKLPIVFQNMIRKCKDVLCNSLM